MGAEEWYALFKIGQITIGFGMLIFAVLSSGPGNYDRSTFYLVGGLWLMGAFNNATN